MSHQEAISTVPQPLALVEERLREVESWPMFLEGLELVTKTGHHRYRMVVRSGRSTREVNVAVIPHPREHRFTWKATEGPRYEGEIRLAAVDEAHTQVRLKIVTYPAGFVAGLNEMFGSSNDAARVDLARLEDHLGSASA
jgi:uncharacterized membrane protein